MKRLSRVGLRQLVQTEVRRLRTEQHDPSDYSEDERFLEMINVCNDIALDYGVTPGNVASSLATAVAEGDQR